MLLNSQKKKYQEPTGYRINLYTEEEILVVLTCLNLTDDLDDNQRWIRQDLRTLEPEFVIERMKTCLDSHILSSEFKRGIHQIIGSVEFSSFIRFTLFILINRSDVQTFN